MLVDGIDLRDLDLGAFRRQLGIVPQEAFLFTGTVRDNIAYGRPDATDAEVEAAARAVGAHDFVASLPGGYLNAGERAGPVAVVGPAPAHRPGPGPAGRPGDPAARRGDLAARPGQRGPGAAGHAGRRRPAAPRCSSPTACRPPARPTASSSIDDGQIVEEGTHDELVARGGAYAELWAAFATPATGGRTSCRVGHLTQN